MTDRISLNGYWAIDWICEEPYISQEEPKTDRFSVVNGPVPGYWEDMADLFRTTFLHTKLRCNPMYTLQRYPQAGYVPDMALPNPIGSFVYVKTVSLTHIPDGECRLFIGGVQNAVSMWLNGVYIGRHEGYSAPFHFTLPAGLLQVGDNRITLAVSNNRLAGYMGRPVSGLSSHAANEGTGGIYGDVELQFLPDGLEDVWVTTDENCSGFTVHIAGAEQTEKHLQILDGDTPVYTQTLPAGQSECTVDSQGYLLWSPDTPNLYTAVVTTQNQTIRCRFGIRRLTVEGIRLRLNGKFYYFRGSCEHCYQPTTVYPTRSKLYYRMVIRKLKELGFNSIRFHTWVPPYEYMEAADELGMLMEIETPNNTTCEELADIIRYCRHHAAVNMYSTGNELSIDHDYEQHLHDCAGLVHSLSDSLFSPMSALRGIEYFFIDDEYIREPFQHNSRRLNDIGKFCDLYNSYSNGLTSYVSASGTQPVLDRNNSVYGKPLLSHEICIHGTYIDLSLEERYKGTRIGDTELISSVRKHLEDKGLLDRANLYYRNSAAWQQSLRKHCFETVRRCNTFAGYDFLGDIDTHWHTFGYCVGMMNEFYELKPGETVENVRRYNSAAVLLADLPACLNYTAGSMANIPIHVSNYGEPLSRALLQLRVNDGSKVIYRKELRFSNIPNGEIYHLCDLALRLPKCEKPLKLTITATLSGGDTDCDNRWDIYVFPKLAAPSAKALKKQNVAVLYEKDPTPMLNALNNGQNVVLFGVGPFASSEVSWQIALAGRTNGHLATVIADHPLMEDFPHSGWCDRQFEHMLNSSRSALLDITHLPHHPIIDIASAYKNAHREAMLFEYAVGNGKLLVCTLRFTDEDPAACWLKNRILQYAASSQFAPAQRLTFAQLASLCKDAPVIRAENANMAMNLNDITMKA